MFIFSNIIETDITTNNSKFLLRFIQMKYKSYLRTLRPLGASMEKLAGGRGASMDKMADLRKEIKV